LLQRVKALAEASINPAPDREKESRQKHVKRVLRQCVALARKGFPKFMGSQQIQDRSG
jgi:hypothetical protein